MGITIKLLPGTKRGNPGDVITMSPSAAEVEINAGLAVLDVAAKPVAATPNGFATLDGTGKLAAAQAPASGGSLSATVTLTSAQILLLSLKGPGGTAATLVPAPGNGNIINLLSVTCNYDFGTIAYADAHGNLKGYVSTQAQASAAGGSGVPLVEWMFIPLNTLLEGTEDAFVYTLPSGQPFPKSTIIDSALVFFIGGDTIQLTSGDGTLTFVVEYEIVQYPS